MDPGGSSYSTSPVLVNVGGACWAADVSIPQNAPGQETQQGSVPVELGAVVEHRPAFVTDRKWTPRTGQLLGGGGVYVGGECACVGGDKV